MATMALAPLQSEAALMLLGEDRDRLQALAVIVDTVRERVAGLEIASDADAARVNDLLSQAKVALDKLEEDRTKRKAPVLAEGRAIDGLYKPAQTAFDELRAMARAKLAAHIRAKQDQAAEALQRSLEAQEKAARALDEARAKEQAAVTREGAAEAREAERVATTALVEARREMPLEAVPTSVRSQYGHSKLTFKQAVKVTDLSLVPRRFLERAIREESERAVKLGRVPAINTALLDEFKVHQAPVEGAEFFEEPVLSTRVGLQ